MKNSDIKAIRQVIDTTLAKSIVLNLPNFPPPPDYVVSYTKDGQPLSRYSHNSWNFRAYDGGATFNFLKQKLSDLNLNALHEVLLLILCHPALFPGQINSCRQAFTIFSKFAAICEKNQICLRDLYKFPKLFPQIFEALPRSRTKVHINFLHKFLLNTKSYGIGILSRELLKFLSEQVQDSDTIQRAYIPSRIYNYQLRRLDEFLDDFIEHKQLLCAAFDWISEAYEHNQSVRKSTNIHEFSEYLSPFYETHILKSERITYEKGVEEFLKEYGLLELFKKWLGPIKKYHLRNISRYMTLVRDVSILYILNFSVQRLNEATSLRSDCFETEKDLKLGDIGLIIGETTKYEPDSDARWVVPVHVKKAVDAATTIALLRIRFIKNDTANEIDNRKNTSLPLMLAPIEPWIPTRCNSTKNQYEEPISKVRYGHFMAQNSQIFDLRQITITEKDFQVAVAMTPSIANEAQFQIGKIWPFSAHQLRRTTCVNMFSSHIVSTDSIQWEMKHISEKLSLYYGRNYTSLRLNSEAESMVVIEGYKAMYNQLIEVVTDNKTYIRPHKKEMIQSEIINLVANDDEAKLTKLIKKGITGCRKTLLGFCMKSGPCVYGGIESGLKCAIGDGGGICVDAIFDRTNLSKLQQLKTEFETILGSLHETSPRWHAINQEIKAIEVYSDVCSNK
jgi:hypothetical protein